MTSIACYEALHLAAIVGVKKKIMAKLYYMSKASFLTIILIYLAVYHAASHVIGIVVALYKGKRLASPPSELRN